MVIAEYLESGTEIRIDRLALAIIAVLGISIAGITKIIGGFWTTFNAVFAISGYGALVLLIYSLGIGCVNRFVISTSAISYGLYLNIF